MHLLFVGTANACRSPMAERLVVHWARSQLGDVPAAALSVGSAGTHPSGMAMNRRSATALMALGGDPTGFRPRQLTAELVEAADLVLTMTRHQQDSVLRMAPRALRRTFTLAEAAALADVADLSGLAVLPPQRRSSELGRRLHAARGRRHVADLADVPDPGRHLARTHRAVGRRISATLRPLTDVLLDATATPAAGVQMTTGTTG